MQELINLGTRGSKLAMWQSDWVSDQLRDCGLAITITKIKTTGDLIQDRPLKEIGETGIFTKALDEALLNSEVDIAVHSAKDLASTLHPDLEIIAFCKREDPRDVLLSFKEEFDLENQTQKFIVGTSSVRRKALLNKIAPHFQIKDIRGNLDSRVQKLENGEFDGIILAMAGVKRMGYTHLVKKKLNTTYFPPAVGQGAVAVICKKGNPYKDRIREALNHSPTEIVLKAERSFLKDMGGGCHEPVYALGTIIGDKLTLMGGKAIGKTAEIVIEEISGVSQNAENLGQELALLINDREKKLING